MVQWFLDCEGPGVGFNAVGIPTISYNDSMQRDMELVRKIMLAAEQHEHGFAPRDIEIEGYSEEQIGYHCWLLDDAGLAEAIDLTTRGSDSPCAALRSLTWAGHEFLGAAKDDTTWQKAKDRLSSAGKSLQSVTLDVLKALLVDVAKQQLRLGS